MSASSKKKLRKEQEAVKLTERQLSAQKEAKKVNLYTICFVTVMAVLLVVAIVVGVNQTITSSGIREKNTVAMTVGDHKVSNAEMNYFFRDSINSVASYAAMFGIDTTKPLNEQVTNEETGTTWADDFLESAKSTAKAAYAVADAANAAGFSLTEEQQTAIDTELESLNLYAAMYGFADGEAYLKAMYGNGATIDSFRDYRELLTLANAYQTHYNSELTYEDADIRAKEAENFDNYSSYSYNTYYLSASRFLEGGTTAEDGTTTYSDEEKAAAVAAAEETAKALTAEEIASVADLDAAIAALPVNAGISASSTASNNLFTSVSSTYSDWVTNASRKEGDKTYIANTLTTTSEDGTENTRTDGYYVIFFNGVNDNTFQLKDVRHILVSFQGGTTDPNTGMTTYTEEEKAAAKTEAEAILASWKDGEATEESFIALAQEKSADTGSAADGGLISDIHPGSSLVENFLNWSVDSARKVGDTGIVESTYGYHIMYYVGENGQTYRDFLIENELRSADAQDWFNGLVEAAAVTDGDYGYVSMDLVLSGN